MSDVRELILYFYINLYTRGERLGPATGPVLIWIKFVCFFSKYCVRIDKCVFIVVKIKCVNSSRISDIWPSGARENFLPFGRGSNLLCPPQTVCACV